MSPDLSVVLPAHDEADGIVEVITSIRRHVVDRFEAEAVEVVVVDDDSSDATADVLDDLAADIPQLRVVRQRPNRGHGPTLVRAVAASSGSWVFHLDSDGQFDAADFWALWEARDRHDLLLGVRATRRDPRHRLVLSALVAVLAGRLAGASVADANSPFKLFRRSLWDDVLPLMPGDPFAPSVLLTIGAHRLGRSVAEVPVTHLARPHGESHLRPVRLSLGLAAALRDTAAFVRRLPPRSGR